MPGLRSSIGTKGQRIVAADRGIGQVESLRRVPGVLIEHRRSRLHCSVSMVV